MNKYLLLRDNKQSGPFTAEELIATGMKAHDLIWIEGKSAAWRYPEEIDELKPHLTYAVDNTTADNDCANDQSVSPRNTVHVSLPGKQASSPAASRPASAAAVHTNSDRLTPPISAMPFAEQKEPVIKYVNEPIVHRRNNRMQYAVIFACFFLLITVSYLIISYKSQKEDIHELNAIIQKLEQKARSENTVISSVASLNRRETQPFESSSITLPPKTEPTPPKRLRSSNSNRSSAVMVTHSSTPLLNEHLSETPSFVPPPAENLYALVSVKPNKYKTGVLGGISGLTLELTNNSSKELRRVTVEIKYLGPEKKVVRTQTVFFENVAPGSQPIIEVPKSNRGVNIDYSIINID